jgi:hypothetical protein
MEITLKKAVAVALAVGAALAGTAAQAANTITNLPNTAGGSDLVLFVSDTAAGAYFAQDLGVGINSTVLASKVVTDGVLTTAGSFATPTSFAGPDAALAAFLTTHAADLATNSISYSILASDDTSALQGPGNERALITSPVDYSVVGPSTTFTNGNIKTFTAQSKIFFNAFDSGTSSYAGGNTSTTFGWGAGTAVNQGPNAPISWISASRANGGLIGTAQTMFLFGSNGAGLASASNPYVGGTVDVSSAGVITVTNASPVPLPAAVWLLGSGLLGLVGVGRRRAAAV